MAEPYRKSRLVFTEQLAARDKEFVKVQRLLALLHHRLTLLERQASHQWLTDPQTLARQECAEILLTFPEEILKESYFEEKEASHAKKPVKNVLSEPGPRIEYEL